MLSNTYVTTNVFKKGDRIFNATLGEGTILGTELINSEGNYAWRVQYDCLDESSPMLVLETTIIPSEGVCYKCKKPIKAQRDLKEIKCTAKTKKLICKECITSVNDLLK